MEILYASCLCSENKYKELFASVKNKPEQQVQKFNRLMAAGHANITGVQVHTATVLQINLKNSKPGFFRTQKESIKGVNYNYLCVANFPVIKKPFNALACFIYSFRFFRANKDSFLVADCLNQSAALGAVLASKILRKKSVGIVTDLPDMLTVYNKVFQKINNFVIRQFDSYVFLTKEMDNYINKKGKPHVIIEGLVDIEEQRTENSLDNKYEEKVCLYSGSLDRQNGIAYLVEAFIKSELKHASLHIYGDGNYRDELIEICKKHSNILYFGVVLNEYVVKEQQKATLLINPRPTHEEYTKYSFPSKNMEYMVSGTPVLTTKLPGMPEEYYEYVYFINDETVDGLCETLEEILSKPAIELHQKGKRAKEFVLEKKNNVKQAKKILDLIELIN